ncbi:B3/4 domain-containing protein [Proteiniphilum sp.]|uniref:B3/B4 domain-containing protein n=1 Tax=Proteiniphilum sp. TaxID=1926877 RepID=UPI002B2172A3|nr:phenylalanine--tRNA ligase beta subunit-related protein [Proteiniphilum sp.]MEA4917943.1 phenylalanine--tRNA ligase beta subunit-related protein [Proteiniphilum sp.]
MQNRKIIISEKIREVCPEFHVAAITCDVRNNSHNSGLWQEINAFCSQFSTTYKMEDINQRPAIYATRQAYKKLGKDPNRYRPSAEALCRRILKGQELYQIDALVDLINLVSLHTGYSIGGFDLAKIQGNLMLGVGESGEQFEAIGRGLLNIEGLPVYRDAVGGIGTPTSDEERTKITSETIKLLMLINGYSGKECLQEATDYSVELLKKYAEARNIKVEWYTTNSVTSSY